MGIILRAICSEFVDVSAAATLLQFFLPRARRGAIQHKFHLLSLAYRRRLRHPPIEEPHRNTFFVSKVRFHLILSVKGATAAEEANSPGVGIVLSMSVVCGAPALVTPPRERIEAALRRLRKVSDKPFSSEVAPSMGI
jgi:hypothetical protein